MSDQYVYLMNVASEVSVPEDGILSRTLQNDSKSKVILFGFAPGQELTAHTAPFPAILQFVEGEATLQLGSDTQKAGAGTFAYMSPNLEHGIKAKSRVIMLLIMIKDRPQTGSPARA